MDYGRAHSVACYERCSSKASTTSRASPATRRGNVEFYAGALGLRMVKKTVNQDDPTVYHLFYADERGSPGADITFFEYPGLAARPRRRRDGPPVSFRVGSEESLDFWEERLAAERRERRAARSFRRSGGSQARAARRRLGRRAADRERARTSRRSTRFAASQASARTPSSPERSELLLEALGFEPRRGWEARGDHARRLLHLRPAAGGARAAGRGHGAPRRVGVALEEHEAWRGA